MTNTPSSVSKFCFYYDGEDHRDHEMNILALGKSLTALGKTIYAANGVLNGYKDDARIDVRVNADFIEGSFGVEVEIFQFLHNAKDVVVALGLTAVSGGGLLAVVDWLKGKQIDVIEKTGDGKSVIKVGSEELNCDEDISKLVADNQVRKSLEQFIYEPLLNEGTDTFAVKGTRRDTVAAVEINKEHAEYFKAPTRTVKDKVEGKESEAKVQFVNASVAKKAGWKMIYKGEEYSVRMNDEAFLARLQNMEEAYVFGKTFNVKLKEIKTTSSSSERIRYEISKVHHRSMG